MNKRGLEIFKLIYFALAVLAFVVIVSGVVPRMWSYFTTFDKPKEYIGKGFENIDFKFLTKEQREVLATDPIIYMNKLEKDADTAYAKGSYEDALLLYRKYFGICNGDANYKDPGMDDLTFSKLSQACTSKEAVLKRIEEIEAFEVKRLKDEIDKKLNSKSLNGLDELFRRLEELSGNEERAFIGERRKIAEELKKHVQDEINTLGLVHPECLTEQSVVSAWICEGNAFLNAFDKNFEKAKAAYLMAINATRDGTDEDRIISYFALGNYFEVEGDKVRAYNIYEDIVAGYGPSHSRNYQDVLQKLQEVYNLDQEFYIKNVRFTIFDYSVVLHGSVDETGGADNFEWYSPPLIDDRGGLIDFSLEDSKLRVEFSFNPFRDLDEFGTQNVQGQNIPVLMSGATGVEEGQITKDLLDCIDYNGELKRWWGPLKGTSFKGIELVFRFYDLNGNLLCEDYWISEGKEFTDGSLFRRQDICRNVFINNLANGFSLVMNGNSCESGTDNDFLLFYLQFDPLDGVDFHKYIT